MLLSAYTAGVLAASQPAPPVAGAIGGLLAWGRAGDPSVSVMRCSDGGFVAAAAVPGELALAPIVSADGTSLHVLTDDGAWFGLDMPMLSTRFERNLPMRPRKAALSGVSSLLAIGSAGRTPLVVLDARSGAIAHSYDVDVDSQIDAIAYSPDRDSFVVGVRQQGREPQVWELALAQDAPVVYSGLVHDYRMGEAIPSPGRFTPRRGPVSSPTASLVAGSRPAEWLRVDARGVPGVVQLDVRREIVRFELPSKQVDGLLAAAWSDGAQRGWLLGHAGSRTVYRLTAGDRWTRSNAFELAEPLLSLAPMRAADGTIDVVFLTGNRPGLVWIGRFDSMRSTLDDVRRLADDDQRLTLQPSIDERCVAAVDAQGRWLGSIVRAPR